jgi:hypothetical protein
VRVFRSKPLKDENARSLNCDTCEHAAAPRAGVNIDSIMPDIWMRDGCVAVHHDFSVLLLGGEKILAYPDQIMRILLIEWHAWANSRMHEQKVAAEERVLQALQEQLMRSWQCHPQRSL